VSWVRALEPVSGPTPRSGVLKQALALLATLALTGGCRDVPSRALDAGRPRSDGGGGAVHLVYDRTLNVAGESPSQLLAAGLHLLAITDRAVYLLDDEARTLGRTPLPGAPGSTLVTSASWDGTGFGATVRWSAATPPPGTYFALSDAAGALSPATFVPLTSAAGGARADWDGQAHVALSATTGAAVELQLDRFPRGGSPEHRVLQGGLPLELRLGALAARPQIALCTVEPDGNVALRRYDASGAQAALPLLATGQRAVGSCLLAAGARSWVVGVALAARPVARLDGGGRDLGLGSVSFDVPAAQLATSDGRVLPVPSRLSLLPGTVWIETILWDGQRYLVLLNAPGLRGGRLALATVDEAGQVARDLEIPLVYEPGQLGAAQLARLGRALYVIYTTRLPWDDAPLLHLARLEPTDPS
jgi:hypothetical protein